MSNTYIIPIKDGPRITPWKPGQKEATERGISERKHRETADALWLAKRNNSMPPGMAELKYAPPCLNPIYKTAMDGISQHQGRKMRLQFECGSCWKMSPNDGYTLAFICEELIEKGWPSEILIDHINNRDIVYLISDFTV